MSDIILQIQEELKKNADNDTRKSGERFFKEEVKLYGVKTVVVGKIGKEYFKVVKDLGKDKIFELCEELWQSGVMEESFIACNWSYFVHNDYEEQDFLVFKRWVDKYVSNWASCDTLCNHTIGTFVLMYPKYVGELKKWSKSDNRWARRAAAVSLIVPAKKGEFLPEIMAIATLLLIDRDDMVQKGYGWMLKASSQAHEQEIFEYVMKNKKLMPRTALRYAIEKMPVGLKKRAMAK
jgi:3-methyladenine DNA glycosylase AlkD